MKVKRYEVIETLYDFEELTEEAKENARRKYVEVFHDTECFSESCKERVNELFPNSDKLQIEYSLSYCQGDGFNIYGKMDLKDAIDYVMYKTDVLRENIRFFEWLKTLGYKIELSHNNHYSYCYVEYNNFADDIQWLLDQDGYTSNYDKHYDMLCDFDREFKAAISDLCKDFENDGYSYFYDTDDIDDELIDLVESNGWSFDENGNINYYNE